MKILNVVNFLFYFFVVQFTFGQNHQKAGTKIIDSYFQQEEYDKADSVLKEYITSLKSKQLYDSLINYIYYVGKVNIEINDVGIATSAVSNFVKEIEDNTSALRSLRQLYLELSSFYELAGNSLKAYECNIKALEYTKEMKDARGEEFGIVYSNLGTLAKRTGNLGLSTQHHRTALKYLESDSGSGKERIYITYNALGGQMWFASKIDSALYYYNKAEKILLELEQTPINKYYRPAMLGNNISAIYNSQGNVDKAMIVMKSAIDNLTMFLQSDSPDVKKEGARSLYYSAIENYAGIYKELGDFEKAKDLLTYSYIEKQKYFDVNSPELFRSKILLGQIYLALMEYEIADEYLSDGIDHIERIPGAHYFWNADAHYYKATISEETGNTDLAAKFYEIAQELYEQALQGAYDAIYLEFIIKASYFYAKNGDHERAISMANKTYDYVVENQGEKTLFEFHQLINLGEIYYVLEDYEMALGKSKASLELLRDPMFRGNSTMDSLFITFQKPQAILLKTKSEYNLKPKNDTVFLKETLEEILEAISILEQRKPFIGNDNNLSILISDNSNIFEFAKSLALELYWLINSQEYLDLVFSIHESSLYNRIRSRLSTKNSISFNNVPEGIQEEEEELRTELSTILNKQNSVNSFFDANDKWTQFLQNLKLNYPEYYELKYASISESFENIENHIPNNTTIVRYIFVSDSLYVLVLNESTKQIYKLNEENIDFQITQTYNETLAFEETSEILYSLYTFLWKPFESEINTDHIVIIPDRELFNLSFEVLTLQSIKSYDEFAENSLLSSHSISYNYSLLLINQDEESINFTENFIAFVPEFNDKMKEDYKISISDSLSIDKTYLTLLPQPFSLDLAKSSAKLFDGKSFFNENSTKQIFKNNAKEHKIIHIGTHAESNNLSPELSRIIFAKNISEENPDAENSIFTYEIYDYNLSSNLTILTACETGKPTYQPGEGMISLAHAFNYAGSESILTSLWKIDEKSSVKIAELFYRHLLEGLPKDKALQQAKLEYLALEEGRTLSPNYWAGLILIGDTSPIHISTSGSNYYWFFGLMIITGFIFFLIRKKR